MFSQCLLVGRPLLRFPWSACGSVLGQDTEPQTALDVLVGTLLASHCHQCICVCINYASAKCVNVKCLHSCEKFIYTCKENVLFIMAGFSSNDFYNCRKCNFFYDGMSGAHTALSQKTFVNFGATVNLIFWKCDQICCIKKTPGGLQASWMGGGDQSGCNYMLLYCIVAPDTLHSFDRTTWGPKKTYPNPQSPVLHPTENLGPCLLRQPSIV